MSKKNERVLAGHVGVDAGLMWIGDPCYVMGDGASHRVSSWSEFCDKLDFNQGFQSPLGDGAGVVTSTGWGDGYYPVYVTFGEEGRVAKVEVEFM